MKRMLLLIVALWCAPLDAQSVKLAWDSVAAPTTCTTTPLTYNLYRSTTSGGASTLVNQLQIVTAPTDAAPYVDASVQAGMTYYYTVTAKCGASESARSNEVSATVPSSNLLPPLAAPVGLTLSCSADGKTMTARWNALLGAVDYWPRAQYTDDRSFIAAANKDGGNPSTSIAFAVVPAREVEFWVHGFNALNQAADPTYPSGVGFLS